MTKSPASCQLPPKPYSGHIISSNLELVNMVLSIWDPEIFEWTSSDDSYYTMDSLLSSPPNVVLLDMIDMGERALEILSMFKEENIYRVVPIVLCLNEKHLTKYALDWRVVEADDLLFLPSSFEVIKSRLELVLGRASRSMDTNALTYLPGNRSIINFAQSAIYNQENFAFAYADLDNFKAFNDKYGFARGDEILMLTSRLISSIVLYNKSNLRFVGHIGGDDFVFCLPPDKIEDACKQIISSFDEMVPRFYDEDDREAGKIISIDRLGKVCTFPLMGISLAVVFSAAGDVIHYGKLAERAAQVKKLAKNKPESAYVLDRRKYTANPIKTSNDS